MADAERLAFEQMLVHNLKAPLTGILASLEMLYDGDLGVLSDVQRSAVGAMQVPTAQVLLAMDTADGEPFFADPRQVLRRAARPLQELGLTAVVATELEFYLLDGEGDQPSPRVGRIPGTR